MYTEEYLTKCSYAVVVREGRLILEPDGSIAGEDEHGNELFSNEKEFYYPTIEEARTKFNELQPSIKGVAGLRIARIIELQAGEYVPDCFEPDYFIDTKLPHLPQGRKIL